MTNLYTDPFGPPWRLNWLRMTLQWRGSIFQFFWVEWLSATILCALFLLMLFLLLRDEVIEDVGESMQYLISSLNYVHNRFQAALSLMLGFYTTTIFNRWWKVRDTEGVAMGRINDLAVQIASLIGEASESSAGRACKQRENGEGAQGECEGQDEDEEADSDVIEYNGEIEDKEPSPPLSTDAGVGQSRKTRCDRNTCTEEHIDSDTVRVTLVRWLNLSHAVAVGELYEKKPNEFSSLDQLVEYGLLKKGWEYDCLSSATTSRYAPPFVWFLSLLRDLKERKECGVVDPTIVIFSGNITRIRGALADLYMYRNTPIPLSYRQLVNVTVRTYVVLIGVAGGLSAFESCALDDRLYFSAGIFWILLPFGFSYFMFVGWLSLADALGNPFRRWADEFEWENYVRSTAISSNLYVTQFREGRTSATQLKEISSSAVGPKVCKAGAKWGKIYSARDDDIAKGLCEICQGNNKGCERVRRCITGF